MLQHWTMGDTTTVVPWARWDSDAVLPGKRASRSRFGAFLPTARVTSFDCVALGIAPGEARTVDPQQRMLLEVSGPPWSCLPFKNALQCRQSGKLGGWLPQIANDDR